MNDKDKVYSLKNRCPYELGLRCTTEKCATAFRAHIENPIARHFVPRDTQCPWVPESLCCVLAEYRAQQKGK